MDIAKAIRDDHERILAIIDSLEDQEAADATANGRHRDQLGLMLTSHIQAEEQLVYPLLQQDDEGRELMLLALEEHHIVNVLLAELLVMPAADERFPAKCAVLAANLEDHLESEEEDLLPLLLGLLDPAEALALGQRFADTLTRARWAQPDAA